MEKNGSLTLTREELESFQKTGDVPFRLCEAWSVTSDELSDIIKSGCYTLID